MGDPAPGWLDDDSTWPVNYLIIDYTNLDPDNSDDEFDDEAWGCDQRRLAT